MHSKHLLSQMKLPLMLAILMAAGGWQSQGFSAVIAQYGFDGQVMTSQDTDLNTVAGTLADGGITGSALTYETRSAGVRGNPVPSLYWVTGDYNNGTILDGDYLSFTIAPNSGYQIDFTSLSVDHFNATNAGSTVYFFSDQAGFASVSDAIGSVFLPDYDTTSNFTASVSLAGLATATLATEFRIYFDTTASFTTGDVWTDNIVLQGNVTTNAIPEPSVVSVLGLAGMMILGRRRRKA